MVIIETKGLLSQREWRRLTLDERHVGCCGNLQSSLSTNVLLEGGQKVWVSVLCRELGSAQRLLTVLLRPRGGLAGVLAKEEGLSSKPVEITVIK